MGLVGVVCYSRGQADGCFVGLWHGSPGLSLPTALLYKPVDRVTRSTLVLHVSHFVLSGPGALPLPPMVIKTLNPPPTSPFPPRVLGFSLGSGMMSLSSVLS